MNCATRQIVRRIELSSQAQGRHFEQLLPLNNESGLGLPEKPLKKKNAISYLPQGDVETIAFP